MKNRVLAFLIFISVSCFTQKKVTWEDLANVTFDEKYYPQYSQFFLSPTFSDSVKALEGQEITLKGYFLSLDPTGEIYILSKGPMSSCFFCGVGGPETAVELHFISKPPFKTDDIITVTGVLKLNSDDVKHFNYILKRAQGRLVK